MFTFSDESYRKEENKLSNITQIKKEIKEIKEIITEFQQFTDWEKKYKHIIEKGKELPQMDKCYQTDENKVKGCQSDVWLFPEYRSGKMYFQADSNSAIVKGLISLLMRVFNQQTPDTILKTDLGFLEDIGLQKHLSPTRSNGLVSMIKQIKLYAYAMKIKYE